MLGFNGLTTKEWTVTLKVKRDTQSSTQECLLSCGSPAQGGDKKSRGNGAPASIVAPHLLVVFLQTLVVFTQRGQVDEGDHILEAVDPLLAF